MVKKFEKFKDVMAEIQRSGAAIYKNPAGTEDMVVLSKYSINYVHSYAEDSKFFMGLAEGKLYGSECRRCGYRYGTPRSHCMECGAQTRWIELPLDGRVHSWTTCYFGSEEFMKETPFNLVLVEFAGVRTLFLSRLVGPAKDDIYIGMKVKAKFRKEQRHLVSDVYFVPA